MVKESIKKIDAYVIIGIVVAALILISSVVLAYGYSLTNTNNVYDGVKCNGYDLSGKSLEACESEINNMIKISDDEIIGFKTDDREFELTAKQIGFQVYGKATANAAYSYGRDENGRYEIATVSYELTTNLLKEKLGFKGVVVTDAITMGGCECNNTLKVSVEAFEAGADVILFGNLDAIDVIVEKLEKGEIPMSRLEDALNRIYELKKKTGVLDKKENTACIDDEFISKAHSEEIKRGTVVKTLNPPMFPIDKNKVKKLCVVGVNCGGNPDFTQFIERLKTEGFSVDYEENIYLKNETVAKEFQEKYDLILFTFAGGTNLPIIPGEVGMPVIWTIKRIDPHKKFIIQFGMPKMYELYFMDEPVYINPLASISESYEVVDNLVKVMTGDSVASGELYYNIQYDENL